MLIDYLLFTLWPGNKMGGAVFVVVGRGGVDLQLNKWLPNIIQEEGVYFLFCKL